MSDATLPVVYVLNGPKLSLLGKREPHIYGLETLADVERDVRALASELRLAIRFHQSNREYEIIEWIHEARDVAAGIVINPAAFTHTSAAVLDALTARLTCVGTRLHPLGEDVSRQIVNWGYVVCDRCVREHYHG